MSVRFVIGRAGAGKTIHCLDAVRRALLASPLEGPRLILLVPEQVSLQMERALLQGLTAAAAHRAEVLSFRRLAYRILSTAGDGGRVAISPAARAMMLRLLLARHESELRYYRRAERFPGLIDRLGRTIVEFIEEAVTPDDLATLADTEVEDASKSLKLGDIRIVYEAYLKALGDSKLDPSQYLDIARQRLSRCPWADGAYLWVDGFAGFSRLERLLLADLARRAAGIEISVLADPESQAQGPWDLFVKPARTMAELTEAFTSAGVHFDSPKLLTGPRRRFVRGSGLDRLESCLFRPQADAHGKYDDIRIVSAPDRRTEVEYAVTQLLTYVRRRDDPLRYRDIAIIARDLEPYDAMLHAALTARGVPYFMDRRRPIGHHPLIRFLRDAIALAAGDFSVDAVRSLLKAGLIRLEQDDADALENHLVATNLNGRAAWIEGEWPAPAKTRKQDDPSGSMHRINTARRTFLQVMRPWVDAARNERAQTGDRWAQLVRNVLEKINAFDRIERWAADAESDGNLDVAEAHRQIVRDVDAFLDDLQTTLASQSLNLDELRQTVDAGLGQLTLGLAPPMLDQVLVGAIERSRQPDIRLAIILGCNDGAFPSVPSEDAILNDDDRQWLADGGVKLGTPRRQRIADESLLFYIAATRPRERLLCTYAQSDEQGKELRPSPYLNDMLAACPGLHRETIGDANVRRSDYPLMTERDLAAALASEFRTRPDRNSDDPATRARWNTLYDGARRETELVPAVTAALKALDDANDATLQSETYVDASEPFETSVSQLETYATCPFRHFAQYQLRLQKRVVAPLDAVDVGTIHHAILEEFIKRLVEQNRSLADLDDASLLDGLRSSVRAVSESTPEFGTFPTARDRYLAERSDDELVSPLASQQRRARVGRYRPKAAELAFGQAHRPGIPGLSIRTPKGRHIVLRGVIDRVDLAEVSDEWLGVVIDYKRTREKRLDLSSVYHGISLQLLAYLLVLAEHGATLAGRPIKPAGALFVSLREDYAKVTHPGDKKAIDAVEKAHRPRGLLDIERIEALAPSKPGWSPHYAVFRKSSGEPGEPQKTDTASAADFARILQHTRDKMATLADKMLDGEISVEPYRLGGHSPCSWCDFQSVCRFDIKTNEVRDLTKFKRTQVFARLSSTGGESDDG